MKHVTFIKPMLPHNVGDRRLVPDEMAARLERDGRIEPNPPDWPATPGAQAPSPRLKRYRTKKA
jgi:hypothetical protein